jgi:hypothetical protein
MNRLARLARVALAVFLAATALWVGDLAAPSSTRACSCVPWPETLAAYRTDESILILSGTVVALNGQRGVFGIEQVFKGPVPGPQMPIDSGDLGMCGLGLEVGARLVMAAFVDQGVLHPSICTPHAFVPSPEAEAMLADAQRSYGGAGPPPGPTNPPAVPTPAADIALPLVLGAVLAVVVLLFGAIALLVRRGRPTP